MCGHGHFSCLKQPSLVLRSNLRCGPISDAFTFGIEPGTHSVSIKNPLGVGNSNMATFDVEPGQTCASEKSSSVLSGQIELAEAD